MHSHTFATVVGELKSGADGEWSKTRIVFTQHGAPNDLEQFGDGRNEPVLRPPEYKTGDLVYPYSDAKN